MADSKSSSSGLGIGTILFLIFMVIKLTNYIEWSWWWVTAPLWIPLLLILGVLAVLGVLFLIKDK